MFNLFDILQGQGGPGMQAIGQQFGLTPDQSRRAMEALLPALTLGLQRNATDPAGFGRLFGLAGTGSSEPLRPPSQPDLLLGQLFGSPALSQAVLQQAAAASGIGTQALRQMLPIMAGMIVASIVHMMLNQQQPAPSTRPEPEPGFPAANFWKEWMDGFLSSAGTTASAPAGAPPRSLSAEPLPKPAGPLPSAAKTEPGETPDVPLEVFQQMFQTGAQVQEQNVKAMQDIFDSFWSRPAEDAQGPASDARDADPPETPKPRKRRTKPGDGTG